MMDTQLPPHHPHILFFCKPPQTFLLFTSIPAYPDNLIWNSPESTVPLVERIKISPRYQSWPVQETPPNKFN